MKRKVLKIFCSIYLVLVDQSPARGQTAQKLEVKMLRVCGEQLQLEIAKSERERGIGLMHRNSLSHPHGMLFIFEDPRPLSFWMKNVPFDIDIGFFDSKGVLINTHTMHGTSLLQMDKSLPSYKSKGPSLYAVEVEKGFFEKHKKRPCKIEPLSELQLL